MVSTYIHPKLIVQTYIRKIPRNVDLYRRRTIRQSHSQYCFYISLWINACIMQTGLRERF